MDCAFNYLKNTYNYFKTPYVYVFAVFLDFCRVFIQNFSVFVSKLEQKNHEILVQWRVFGRRYPHRGIIQHRPIDSMIV